MTGTDMECNWSRERFGLMLYGELTFDEEERVDSHLDSCDACRAAFDRERAMHAALDSVSIEPLPSMLQECREDLRAKLAAEPAPDAPAKYGWWDRAIDFFALGSPDHATTSLGVRVLKPIGALTLVAMGFGLAHVLPSIGTGSGFSQMGLGDSGVARVRNVELSGDGRVQLVLDETRQRTISGRVDDQNIRALLLSATKDPYDPAVRTETIEILASRAQSIDVRDALVYEVQRDPNPGVRMKAMEGLKPFVGQPEVRAALEQVLFSDANPGLRTQAIDLLTGGDNLSVDRNVDPQIVGALQELIERGEQQGYVRERCRTVLKAVNASLETY